MRTLASFHFMSLDGTVESPDRFVAEHLFDDIASVIDIAVRDQDAVLLGHNLYREWADYWPTSSIQPFASFINPVRKYVASSTDFEPRWANTMLLGSDLLTAVHRLKSEAGGTLCVHGSIALTQSLLRMNLIDELRLAVFPVLAGNGRRLLNAKTPPVHLILKNAHQTASGIQYLVYGID
jgi:dihydrofolate reductase